MCVIAGRHGRCAYGVWYRSNCFRCLRGASSCSMVTVSVWLSSVGVIGVVRSGLASCNGGGLLRFSACCVWLSGVSVVVGDVVGLCLVGLVCRGV